MFDESSAIPGNRRAFVHKRIIGAATGFLSGGFVGAATGFVTGGEGRGPIAPGSVSGSIVPSGGRAFGPCPQGQVMRRGVCSGTSFLDRTQQFFPGGQTGTIADDTGEAVIGAFNVPAEVPAQVGTITRNDGTVAPILRCRAGAVLATDNLCYSKGIKGLAAFRKWKPAAKGFLPRRDVACLRRAIAIKKSKSNKAMLRELGLG